MLKVVQEVAVSSDTTVVGGVAMAFKLMQDARVVTLTDGERTPSRRPRPSRRHLDKGKLVERPHESGGDQQVA